jgi:hypothetical protein
LPVVRSRNYTTAPYHIGSVTENRLGLQVFRVVGKYLVRRFRQSVLTEDLKPFVEVLERDGVLVLENFLQPEVFETVRAEFESANKNITLAPYKNAANAKLYRTQLQLAKLPESFPTITANFRENDLLNRITSAVLRRPITKKPTVLFDTYQNLNDAGADNDIENILHADLHFPTVKMFFYLNEVNESNGAFVFVKGSHKLTLGRLIHEYELSIREAKLKRGLPIPEKLLGRRSTQIRNIINPKNERRMNVSETQICVKPNTLVIANNMGFHRRGEFTGSEPRKALLVNYRNAEPAFW